MMRLRDPSDLSANERAVWDALAAGSETPDPLSGGSAWQLTALACSRRAGAQILLRQSHDSQVALAVTQESGRIRLEPLEAHWSFGCPLLGPEAVAMLADSIAALRNLHPDHRIACVVSGLDPQGLHARQISATFPRVLARWQDDQAAASLAGGMEGWLSRRSANTRKNLKRSQRRAREAGIRFERARPVSAWQAFEVYSRMLGIEARSWKGKRHSGLLALRRFYAQLLEAYAARDAARVIFARQGSEDVGFCYGGVGGGVYRGQQTSYSEQVADLGIGTLMHLETAKWLVEDGAHLHHFGPVQRQIAYKARCASSPCQASANAF
ncbi:MAG: GNAT family N-acetyltransferase [Alphaproteobacteria bacterium]|jgi:CelD/BcsL family acetyltransferase involved in cellulose biosynthesis|nr:GNAT family N-acetyltransferase [Alphaproteobacteria bacterium]